MPRSKRLEMKGFVVFDLDGPLLNGVERHYACYSGILRKAGLGVLPRKEYWDAKRRLTPLNHVLDLSGAGAYITEFKRLWLEGIESEEMLARDELQDGAAYTLQRITSFGHKVVIATLRQYPNRAANQMARIGIFEMIDALIACPYQEGARGKAERVITYARRYEMRPLVWVGDTEVDADAAAAVGVPCALLTTGLRSQETLRGLPCVGLFNSLSDIPGSVFLCG